MLGAALVTVLGVFNFRERGARTTPRNGENAR
jgi:hypothetical protein